MLYFRYSKNKELRVLGRLKKKFLEVNKNYVQARTKYSFPTGLDILDYKNGKLIQPPRADAYASVGVNEGSFIQIIGASGAGKSTLGLQIAFNIVRDFPEAEIYIDDIESAHDETRFMTLSGWTADEIEDRITYRDTGVTAESFYESLLTIYKLKKEMLKELTTDTGKLTAKGNPLVIIEPTVYFIDSLAVLSPQDVLEGEEIAGNMAGARNAIVNSKLFTSLIPKLREVNIILIGINHITTKVSTNPKFNWGF